jgi:hypothetical protein
VLDPSPLLRRWLPVLLAMAALWALGELAALSAGIR